MKKLFYFDTSIWLDLFENRDKPNFKKSQLVNKMFNKIINGNNKILYSDINLIELKVLGYSIYELRNTFEGLKAVLIFVESTNSQIGKAKDISAKRHIPKGDALHAILARDNHAALITFDNHFKKLADITKSYKPQEII